MLFDPLGSLNVMKAAMAALDAAPTPENLVAFDVASRRGWLSIMRHARRYGDLSVKDFCERFADISDEAEKAARNVISPDTPALRKRHDALLESIGKRWSFAGILHEGGVEAVMAAIRKYNGPGPGL